MTHDRPLSRSRALPSDGTFDRRVSQFRGGQGGVEPPTFRFSGGLARPGESTTGQLTRPDGVSAGETVHDQPHVSTSVVSTEPFSSCCLAGLDDVDGFGELPGAVAAAELAQDAPGPGLGVGASRDRVPSRGRGWPPCVKGGLLRVLYVVITCLPELWQALPTWVTRPAGPVSRGPPPWSAGCCPRAGRVLGPGGIAPGLAAASPRRRR
jgi:hypothetical protein